MTEQQKLAQLLFSHIDKTPEDYEAMYPPRALPEGAVVTRFAPSPTGFLHIGGLFAALSERNSAKSTDGVFYLRIEDTDQKRKIEGGIEEIITGLGAFGIEFDEGVVNENEQKGAYGPYIQSERREIYQAYAKALVEKGLAYPCFCSAEEIGEIRKNQESEKRLPGYYGSYAKCRGLTYDEIKEKIDAGLSYVLRLKSPGTEDKRVSFKDGIRGTIEMPENIQDIVLLKTDGIPTYHFAHAIDDHLMRTTHVIRGDEWISSTPIHLQLFEVLGLKPPVYAHISPIMKEENGGKRKISKRKDPEAAVSYYHEEGYPKEAVLEYLMTLANSNYEQWRRDNPTAPRSEFPFALKKMSQSGALFDMVKMTDVSKDTISLLTADKVYEGALEWARQYDQQMFSALSKDADYATKIFAIGRGVPKPRKDIAKWSDVKEYVAYFYPELWDETRDFPENLSKEDMIEILKTYSEVYDETDSADDWFPKVRDMSEKLGYAKAPKEYKKNPDAYKGHVGDVSGVIRVAVTGRRNTPDLYEILQLLGKDAVIERINGAIRLLK
jgi:glutamyl-tRNA synthetase